MTRFTQSKDHARRLMKVATAFLLLGVALAGCIQPDEQQRDPEEGAGVGASMDSVLDAFTPINRSIEGLEPSRATQEVVLSDGDAWSLEAVPVRHDPGTGTQIRMLSYNGQIPGPTLRVEQGAEVTVEFTNRLDQPTTVHWHGLRLDVAFDGVPDHPHPAVAPGESFTYELVFPDEGVFWYHPHVREDVQIGLGLTGVIVVEGERAEGEVWPEEHVLALGDIRLGEDGDVVSFFEEVTTFALMGRFGTHYLVNGGEAFEAQGAAGERVRLHLVNVASARPLSLTFPGFEQVEWVGSDGGFLLEPRPVSHHVLSPSERISVDVVLPETGSGRLVQGAPGAMPVTLGTLSVDPKQDSVEDPGAPSGPHDRAREELAPFLGDVEVDAHVTWELDVEMDMETHGEEGEDPHAHHDHGAPIDWDDDGDPTNAASHSNNTRWIIRDAQTGAENMEMDPQFAVGDVVRVTLVSLEDAEHPMQHPIHLHGQRFIVEHVDGEPNPAPVWKDTVLVPGSSQVDILVDMSNPGMWMVHCHTNEHLESGMMGMFTVA